ncbi:hypothetical protein AE19_04641 [Klebsiella pneumoniae UCI 60]|nr:hypothetical protein AE19_04641 [Klebsiella pneumoniae UCI 60]SSM45282.1 Uncharacterised protein [Klebsiella pneumoniae]
MWVTSISNIMYLSTYSQIYIVIFKKIMDRNYTHMFTIMFNI